MKCIERVEQIVLNGQIEYDFTRVYSEGVFTFQMGKTTKIVNGNKKKYAEINIFVTLVQTPYSKMRRNLCFEHTLCKKRSYFTLPSIEVSVLRSSSCVTPLNNRKMFLLTHIGKNTC